MWESVNIISLTRHFCFRSQQHGYWFWLLGNFNQIPFTVNVILFVQQLHVIGGRYLLQLVRNRMQSSSCILYGWEWTKNKWQRCKTFYYVSYYSFNWVFSIELSRRNFASTVSGVTMPFETLLKVPFSIAISCCLLYMQNASFIKHHNVSQSKTGWHNAVLISFSLAF